MSVPSFGLGLLLGTLVSLVGIAGILYLMWRLEAYLDE